MTLLRLHSLNLFKLLFFLNMRSVCNLIQIFNCFPIHLRRPLQLLPFLTIKIIYDFLWPFTLWRVKIRLYCLGFPYLWTSIRLCVITICKRDRSPFLFLISLSDSFHLNHMKSSLAFILYSTSSVALESIINGHTFTKISILFLFYSIVLKP